MTRKFNPLAEHGTVTPPHNGAIYFQDGGYFNAAGELVSEDRPATPPKVVINEQTTVDSATGKTKTKKIKELVDPLPAADPKIVLAAWLKGETELPHPQVRSLVKTGYGMAIASHDGIVDYLVNTAHLVPAEQVKLKAA